MCIKIRQLSIGLTLVAVVMLASCSQKNNESATNTSESATPAATPESTTTTAPNSTESMSKHPGAATTKKKPAVPELALKLGTVPSGETTCPSNAPVKGKVTKKRGNIYHLAKTPDYNKVKPDICFKDQATAEKAGFRAPKTH